MRISNVADNPLGRRDRHAERAGGSSHAAVEGDRRRRHPLRNCEVDGIGCAQVDIETPQNLIRRPDTPVRYFLSACRSS